MPKENIANNSKRDLFDLIQTLVAVGAVLGVAFAGFQFKEMAAQTRLQTAALEDTRKVQSANFVLGRADYLSQDHFTQITTAINGDTTPQSGTAKILKSSGGKFTPGDVDEYISNLDDVAMLYYDKLINDHMVYNEFSYEIEKAFCNQDIWRYILSERQASHSPDGPDAIYKDFENLANRFLQKDNYKCADLDNQ